MVFFKKATAFLFVIIIYSPLKSIWRFLLRIIFFRIYLAFYHPLKKFIKKEYLPAKKGLLYPLTRKYVIHLVIVLITILVTTHSISAREFTEKEIGQESILFKLVREEEEEIIERRETESKVSTNYLAALGTVSSLKSQNEAEAEEEAMTAQGGSALLKPQIAATSEGNRPRDKVEYYIVQGGDTVSTIAQKFDITTQTILWENKLSATQYIKPGDKLTILPASGVTHQIKSGDTIDKIAQKYGVENTEEILKYNKLASAEALKIDDTIIIPGGKMPPPPAVANPDTRSRFAAVKEFFAPQAAQASGSFKFLWPTPSRRINQYFSWRHTGIDIDGSRSPIYAAENGVVEFVGWERGYGLSIRINHGGGNKTHYSHASKTLVQVGQSVSRGETIGITGCTGWCTGDHLHFEVIIGGRKYNPLGYL